MALVIFDEVLLDQKYSPQPTGGVEFATQFYGSPQSGITQVNRGRATPIARFTISFDTLSIPRLEALHAFYITRDGAARGFRVLPPYGAKAERMLFAVCDGINNTFPLKMRYTSGGVVRERRVVKPWAGGLPYVPGAGDVLIYKDNSATPLAGCTVNSTTGMVRTPSGIIYPAGTLLSWSGTAHLPMRFAADRFEPTVDAATSAAWGSIDLIECLPAELGLSNSGVPSLT